MTQAPKAMHLVTTRRQYKNKAGEQKVYETTLLRRSYREDGKVKNETLANLSSLPEASLALLRGSLAGKTFLEAGSDIKITRTLCHGNVAALGQVAQQVGLASLLGPPCRQRNIILGLILARICQPGSKLATLHWLKDTTLEADLDLEDLTTNEIYDAMDWLGDSQDAIEQALCARHLKNGDNAFYDLSSSWMEGVCCPLAKRGYSRDGKKGKLQIEYGLLTSQEGVPLSIEVFPGNTADPQAFVSVAQKVREKFNLAKLCFVGDRGMITSEQIKMLKKYEHFDWVSALKGSSIKKLVQEGSIQLSLFDEVNLFETQHPDYPGERLVVCHNEALGAKRAHVRESLLWATEQKLDALAQRIKPDVQDKDSEADKTDAKKRRFLKDASEIGLAVGKVIEKAKVAKHFTISITDGAFSYCRNQQSIDTEAQTDGIYIIRTSLSQEKISAPEAVNVYKNLQKVERSFRSIKVDDLDLRPIRHWREDRVRSHVFLLMLSRYLVWHLEQAWASITFHDTENMPPEDPVVPKGRSAAAQKKSSSKLDAQKQPVMSLQSVLCHLGSLARNSVVIAGGNAAQILTEPTSLQRRAFTLLGCKNIPLHVMSSEKY
jgi:transposase